jgi:hypothetical protein
MKQRYIASCEEGGESWFVYDNDSFYCCFGPTTEEHAVGRAVELNASNEKTKVAVVGSAVTLRDLEQQLKSLNYMVSTCTSVDGTISLEDVIIVRSGLKLQIQEFKQDNVK